MTSKVISSSDCLEKLKEILDESNHTRKKKQKLGDFENICQILQKCDIQVTTAPEEKVRKKKE